jgi:hypothetical protein
MRPGDEKAIVADVDTEAFTGTLAAVSAQGADRGRQNR